MFVRMIEDVRGTRRYPGLNPYPDVGGVLDLGDDENDRYNLVEVLRWAEDCEGPETEPVHQTLTEAARAAGFGSGASLGDSGSTPSSGRGLANDELVATKPKPYASKPDWVVWAVAQGVSEDAANSLSKNELVARYGNKP